MARDKPMLILTSSLTNPPRYYATRSYTVRDGGLVTVTGPKWDVTDQIEAIVATRQGENK